MHGGGGGNPYGQPDHKILVFLTASLKAFESFAETEKKTVVITFFFRQYPDWTS